MTEFKALLLSVAAEVSSRTASINANTQLVIKKKHDPVYFFFAMYVVNLTKHNTHLMRAGAVQHGISLRKSKLTLLQPESFKPQIVHSIFMWRIC